MCYNNILIYLGTGYKMYLYRRNMTQLTQTLARDLEADKAFLLTMLDIQGRVGSSVELKEEPGEILITILMKDNEIEEAVKEAVKNVLGKNFSANDVSVTCGGRLISFSIFRDF